MKNILIINAHPDSESLCHDLANAYLKGAELSNAKCTLINLTELNFNPILEFGYRKRTELEPDLIDAQKRISSADHLVFVFPNWWGTYPALLKGFIDRVFLPGFAFKYRDNSVLWDKLLTGKTARLIITMDTPKWYYSLVYHSPGANSIKKSVLEFCGIKPVKVSIFTPVKRSTPDMREKWLKKIENMGRKMI